MTTDSRPAPLVPADVDLRGYEFMPLYGDRLFKSETWIAASADAKVAALRLWWHAYAHEVPAASLPDNDRLLAEYAGYGMATRAWQKIKPQAMAGFVLCSDGRLYHENLAAWALEAWAKRVKDRQRKADWKARKDSGNSSADAIRNDSGTVPGDAFRNGSGTADRKGQERNGQERKVNTDGASHLSGDPPDDLNLEPDGKAPANGKAARGQAMAKDARALLGFLNDRAGKRFPPTDTNVGIIVARMKEGFTPDQIRQVVAMKIRKWKGDEKMAEYVRPMTLFGKTNFSNYVGELVEAPDDQVGATS